MIQLIIVYLKKLPQTSCGIKREEKGEINQKIFFADFQ